MTIPGTKEVHHYRRLDRIICCFRIERHFLTVILLRTWGVEIICRTKSPHNVKTFLYHHPYLLFICIMLVSTLFIFKDFFRYSYKNDGAKGRVMRTKSAVHHRLHHHIEEERKNA